MATRRRLGGLSDSASGSNKTVNLVNEPIGTNAVGLGIIAANASGPIPSIPKDGTTRGIVITVDNRDGTADAYLARPEDIPTSDDETAPVDGAIIFPSGQITEEPDIDLTTWKYVLRLLDGADVNVCVRYTGMGW